MDKLLFDAKMRNRSDGLLFLNIGTIYANGRGQSLDAIRILLTDRNGSTISLEPLQVGIAIGREAPLIVPLPPHSELTVRLDLNDYACPSAGIWQLHLDKGKYSVVAEYRGAGVSKDSVSLDMEGLRSLNYWSGTVRSMPIVLDISKRP